MLNCGKSGSAVSFAEITASLKSVDDVEDDQAEAEDVSRNRCKVEAVYNK